MENANKEPELAHDSGLIEELGWLGAGAVLPLTSISFYERGVRRPPMMALIFLLIFGLVVGVLTSLGVMQDLSSFDDEVRQAMLESEFPTITIEDGVARMDAPQPFVLYEDADMAIIIDTTGQITRLSTDTYDQGILMTDTELHVLNEDGTYQITDLSDFNLVFGRDTLVINAETVSEFAGGFANVISVIAFVALLLWHTVGRLLLVSLMALIIWALASTYWRGVKYAQVWIVGAYASVAALYITYLLSRLSISICGVQFFLLAAIMLAVTYILKPGPEEDELSTFRPLKLHYAWIGLPMLLVLAYDLLYGLPYQGMFQLSITIAVVVILAALEYFVATDGSLPG